MFKSYDADSDTYITNKVISTKTMTGSNVGAAGTLDLFKLYGVTMSGTVPNTELSRALIHFDLTDMKSMYASGKIDPSDPSFECKIRLKDVYGGQPTPANFTLSVFPLSASFSEGIGKDVARYGDGDVSNWVSSAASTTWFVTGCGLASDPSAGPGDYITSSVSLASTEAQQVFKVGSEDLFVDVTPIVSATLTGEIPDSGFRISFQNTLEDNAQTYFVKRFASRNAYDETKRPKLFLKFDDSITDDTQNLTLDAACNITLYNSVAGTLTNIASGSGLTPVTGHACLFLKLTTDISGGNYDLYFTGSQFSYGSTGTCFVTGTYQAAVTVSSSDPNIASKLLTSSSLVFTPVWTSLDDTVAYVTGSSLTFRPPTRTGSRTPGSYVASVTGLRTAYSQGSEVSAGLNLFDYSNPYVTVVKIPVETPGVVVKNAYYQVRDAVTSEIVIPFDDVKESTKVSSDASSMFFSFDTSPLLVGHTYLIDVMVMKNGTKNVFAAASPVFRIDSKDQA